MAIESCLGANCWQDLGLSSIRWRLDICLSDRELVRVRLPVHMTQKIEQEKSLILFG